MIKFPDSHVPEYIKEIRNSRSCFLGNSQRYINMFKEFDEMENSHSDEELYAIYMCDIIRMLVDIMLDHITDHNEDFSTRKQLKQCAK